MDPRFVPYPSISNCFENWEMTEEDATRLNAVDWVVTEKVHGANFSFIVTADLNVVCARRTSILKEKETFFHHQNVMKELSESFQGMFKEFASKHEDLVQIQIFGELYGGIYPHPDVPKVKQAKAVQQGIYYHPGIKFEIYDILLLLGEDPRFIDWDHMVAVAEQFSIPYSPVLFRGNMEAAMKVSERFPSTIYKKYELPEIENNLAEGIVVRPAKEMDVTVRKELERCILKKKIEEFRETIPAAAAKVDKSAAKADDNPAVAAVKEYAAMRITENRLDAAISKVGPVTEKANFKKILDEFTADVGKDLMDSNVEEWKALQGPAKKEADKFVLGECRAMIAKRMKK